MATKPALSTSGQWSATLNHHELKVTGQLTMPTPGFTITLKKKEPQGINAAILLLEMTIVAPTGIEPQHTVNQTVTFEEHTTAHYQEVEILPERIKIPVKHV